ncbi:MAG: isopentenyl-diphosphate Delta-isomerase [Candidatus Levybacteria bacterium]|nr:isopentenyl-diphosphate Delta-isomerase [Candidatus Levybacteria bacterium]
MAAIDHIVLVDKNNNVLGVAPKLESHNKNTPLHRAFSLFLFNSKGELLLQQRSKNKKTWPLVWSNSVCGHPMLNEKNSDAVKRRLEFELGIKLEKVYEILPNFSYRAEMNGIVENELCPVLVAFTNADPIPNTDEIESIRWIKWQDFTKEIKEKPGTYSVWCEMEAKLLENNKEFLSLWGLFASS